MRQFAWMRGPLRDPAGEGQGGGGDPKPAFDEAQTAAITGLVNTAINGVAKRLETGFTTKLGEHAAKFDGITALLEELKTGLAPNGGDKGDKGTSDEATAVLKMRKEHEALQKRIDASEAREKAAGDRADKAERASILSQALSGLPFVSDKAKETARNMLAGQLRRLDDGTLVAGEDGVDPTVYLPSVVTDEHAYLLKAPNAGGSGAGAPNGERGSKGWQMDDIKTANAEQRAQMGRDLAAMASQSTTS